MNFGILIGAAMVVVSVLVTTAIISRVSEFYRRELAGGYGRRELPLDGLRGFAALMVVTHHAAMFHMWVSKDRWGETGVYALQTFGPAGVSLFFMLTGYLFWGKARAAGGKFNLIKLWRGRLFRIGPCYLFTAALVIAIFSVLNGIHFLNFKNWNSLFRLASLGLFLWRPMSGIDPGQINAHVTWTLWYEWRFYFVLPFIAWFAMGRRVFWLAAAAYVGVFVAGYRGMDLRMQLALVFFLGMFCPVLLEDEKLRMQLRHPVAAVCAVAATTLLMAVGQGYAASISFAVALFPIFLVAAAGNSFWGILTSPGTRCLGAVSYSLYLLHGILFYVVMNTFKTTGRVALPEIYYWAALVLAAVAATLLSALTYRWIEFPFLSRSHKIATVSAPQKELQSVPGIAR
jgi:peptidoglycan/LPS O-acetylase OafA/YrhL